jgi:hypothetical protein
MLMKKKLLIIAGVVLGLTAALLIGLTLFVKSYLQSDKLKALIIPRAEEATGRKVAIDAINVSIFSGISVQGIHLKEKDDAGDFAAIKEFDLNYDLMPLLSKRLVISSIKVVGPFVQVRRDESGRFNFEDIPEALEAKQKTGETKAQSEGGMPFGVTADKISIINARVEFSDAKKEMPQVTAVLGADLRVSAGTEPGALKIAGGVNVKGLDVTMSGTATRTSGTINIEPEKIVYALNTVIGSDTIASTGSISSYLKAPDIRLDLHSKQLDLEKLMAMGGYAKQEVKKPARVIPQTKDGKDVPEKKMEIKAAGEIKVDTARYQGHTVNNFLMKYRYSGGVMTMDPLSLNFASGDKADLSGVMKGAFGFRYSPDKGGAADQIKQTLHGKAVVDLDKAQVKESKMADAIAAFTGLDDLRRPVFDKGHFDITVRDEKTFIAGAMSSPRLKVTPSGSVGFNKVLDMLTDIEVSPETAARLRVGKYSSYMEGSNGWTLIPLKITGTTDKPSVGPNQAALKKQLQRGIQTEIQKRLLKGGSQQQQPQKGEKPKDILKRLFGK